MLVKKINISLDYYNRIIEDMYTFNLSTIDESSSTNEFLTNIIINTYKFQEQSKSIDRIKEILKNEKKGINNKLLDAIKEHKNDYDFEVQLNNLALMLTNSIYNSEKLASYEKKALYIRETKATKNEISTILSESNQIAASDVLKNLLYQYINYPLYTREAIYFNKYYTKLKAYKENKTICAIETASSTFSFKIYDIVPGKEEYHMYIVGFLVDDNKPFCFKLSTIKNTYSLNKSFSFENYEIDYIKEKIEKGPEWISSDFVNNCQIQLDDKGIKRYKSFYKDRPKYTSFDRETKIMTFNCSRTQLHIYFRSFGEHAVVLNDDKLIKGFKTTYTNAYNKYKDK